MRYLTRVENAFFERNLLKYMKEHKERKTNEKKCRYSTRKCRSFIYFAVERVKFSWDGKIPLLYFHVIYICTLYISHYILYIWNVLMCLRGGRKQKYMEKNGNSYHFMLCFVEYVPLSGKYEKLLFAFTFVFRCYVWKNPRKNRFFPWWNFFGARVLVQKNLGLFILRFFVNLHKYTEKSLKLSSFSLLFHSSFVVGKTTQ